jgi:hypothetical protein
MRSTEAAMPNTAKGLSDEKAARMMIALRGGQTQRTFGVGSARIEAYLLAHPDYAREARPLMEANGMAAKLRKGERLRNLTHCVYGHPFAGGNLSFRPNGKRDCLTCVRRRALAPPPPPQEQIQRATAALNRGSSLNLVCTGKAAGARVQAPIVSYPKLKLYRALNQTFDRFVTSVTANSNSKAQQRRNQPNKARATTLRAEANDFHTIVSMVPAHFGPDVRDDIAQSIMVALLEGSLQRDQVKARVQQFVTAHNREANKYGVGKYGLRSIDAPVFADGPASLLDRTASGLWD